MQNALLKSLCFVNCVFVKKIKITLRHFHLICQVELIASRVWSLKIIVMALDVEEHLCMHECMGEYKLKNMRQVLLNYIESRIIYYLK